MAQPAGYDINDLYREAQYRWLKPAEVHYILQNHENFALTQELPQKPKSGSLFLYNKRVLRFFRRDGHSWRKKEAHERLKVGNVEALNCYYAHGEDNLNFQRRSYWMLDPACDHIVLVHYREINEGRANSGSTSHISPTTSSFFTQSPASYSTQNLASTPIGDDLHERHKNICSPESVEVSSEAVTLGQALKRLEELLSLNDDTFTEIGVPCGQNDNSNDSLTLEYEKDIVKQDENEISVNGTDPGQYYGAYMGTLGGSNNLGLQKDEGGSDKYHNLSFTQEHFRGSKESEPWKDMLDSYENSSVIQLQDDHLYAFTGNQEKPLAYSRMGALEEQKDDQWPNNNGSNVHRTSNPLPQLGNIEIPAYSPALGPQSSIDYFAALLGQGQMGMPLEANLTIAQKQKFAIREISPAWANSTESTKVIIIGSFLCDPSECAWACMFGDIEVPLQIIQEGVVCCEAPPHHPGKVTVCITSGNRESCSEIREFEYRVITSNFRHLDACQVEDRRSTEEMLLLVRFVQILFSDPSKHATDRIESGFQLLSKLKADDDSWGHIIESLLDGSKSPSSTIFWLLEELLKDKLQQWLSSRSHEQEDQSGCSLSKKEQGIIHMVAGLGFEWAVNPILNYGVNVNFRDINGWTALHWAARFGREKMVAALIASGAFAGAVTDPTRQDPAGKNPASIADSSGHKGLAGYLSEVALTSHLSSLTLEENEHSKCSAALEAELTVNNISRASLVHQSSLKDTLAAVRNASQAAARIQSAFRAHSFRKRQQWEAAVSAAAATKAIDDYGVDAADIEGFPAMLKLTFGSGRDYNSAALSIQKKYRGWKGRRDFLAFRQKVVKIQAHVRGYQVRKQYKVIWAAGVLEKVILRWRRKGVGLRGFRPETESIDESEEEDILKVFRKHKVDAAIDDAVSKVLSMVNCQEARHQYQRMLEKYRQAKAELGHRGEQATLPSRSEISEMENDMYVFP